MIFLDFFIPLKLPPKQTNKYIALFETYMVNKKVDTCCYGDKVRKSDSEKQNILVLEKI